MRSLDRRRLAVQVIYQIQILKSTTERTFQGVAVFKSRHAFFKTFIVSVIIPVCQDRRRSAQVTFSPNSNWLKQIRHLSWECEAQKMPPRFFLHDNNDCFTVEFDSLLDAFDVEAIRAPNVNAHAERYVLSVKSESLNHLLIFGLNRLQHVLECYSS